IPIEDIDDLDYKLNIDNKGNWLTGENDFNISKKDKRKVPHLLKCNCKDKRGFGYSFFLVKPKEVLILDFEEIVTDTSLNKTALLNAGIQVITQEEKIKKKLSKYNYNHKILVVVSSIEHRILHEKIIASHSLALPNRIIWMNSTEFGKQNEKNEVNSKSLLSHLISASIDNFLKDVWDLWNIYFWRKMKLLGYEEMSFEGYKARKNKSQNVYKWRFLNHAKEYEKYKKAYTYCDIGTSFSFSKIPLGNITTISELIDAYEKVRVNVDANKMPLILLHESVVTKIGIVDERVQSFGKGKYREKITYNELFNKMNICLPKKDIDLNCPNDKIEEVASDLLRWINVVSKKLDFLLIHLGIIEKFFGKEDDTSIKDFIDEIIPDDKDLKVILISGRGKPHNLPKKIRFLNFSQVAYYTCDNQSKYMLTDLCFSARKL
ncbi:MAG: hypothetical protein K8S00_10180, partial [Bacteroidales bacterium]|nr:hypothetical protein [Bacteroidales bacterium]